MVVKCLFYIQNVLRVQCDVHQENGIYLRIPLSSKILRLILGTLPFDNLNIYSNFKWKFIEFQMLFYQFKM